MPLTKQTLLLLALSTTVRADVNHDFQARCPGVSNERGGCYSAGFVDKIQSAEDCQAMCQANPDCEFFSWHYTRGDKRCHLCKDDRTHHKCYPSPNNNCWWGPKYCVGAEEPTPAEKARAAVDAAELICTNPGAVDGDATIKAATDLSAAVKLLVRGELDASDFEGADAAAAAVLARTGCSFNPCNGGAALWSVLETFLLAIDGDADRAFPQPEDRFRKQLFNEQKVFLADAHWLTETSSAAVQKFFSQLPAHLVAGVTHAAPWATMKITDAYHCADLGGVSQAGLVGMTARGFNVFKRQTRPQGNSGSEDAFRLTPKHGINADLLMTVVRHEAAHQFDRTMSTRQVALRTTLKNDAANNNDCLRSGVEYWKSVGGVQAAADFFKRHPNEIIASQVGNQYFHSSSRQLAVARYYADGMTTVAGHQIGSTTYECCSTGRSMIPMEWFLLNVDVIGEEDTVNLYEDETQGGLVTVRSASITRNGPDGRIQELGVPGCGTFAFEYGSDGKLVDYTYDGDEAWDSCVPDGSSLTPPTLMPTAKPTARPTPRPTIKPTAAPTARPTAKPTAPTPAPTKEFPCGVRIVQGRRQDPDDFQCVTDPSATEHAGKKIAFACCEADTCTRKDEDGQCYAGHNAVAPMGWHEASDACAAEGKVLCGVEQPCMNKGCHYNYHYQWTGEECQAGDAGLPAACAAA